MSSGRGPAGAFAFGIEDCLLLLVKLDLGSESWLPPLEKGRKGLRSVLREMLEGDFCIFLLAGASAVIAIPVSTGSCSYPRGRDGAFPRTTRFPAVVLGRV